MQVQVSGTFVVHKVRKCKRLNTFASKLLEKDPARL